MGSVGEEKYKRVLRFLSEYLKFHDVTADTGATGFMGKILDLGLACWQVGGSHVARNTSLNWREGRRWSYGFRIQPRERVWERMRQVHLVKYFHLRGSGEKKIC